MQANKHILFISSWYPSKFEAQAGVFIQKQAKALALFCPVTVLHFELSAVKTIQKEEKTSGNLHEIILHVPKSKISFIHALRFSNRLLKNTKTISHIHLQMMQPLHGVIALYLSVVFNKALYLSEHWGGYIGNPSTYDQIPLWRKLITNRVASRCKKVNVVSSFLKENMKRLPAFSKNTFEVIGNVIEEPKYIEAQSAFADDTIRILSVADFFDPKKNISELLRVFAKLEKNTKTHLTLVGGGPDFERIKQLAIELKIQNIRFTGTLKNEEVYKCYPNCDIFVLNSNVETFGMVPLEALIHNKPIVITNSGGVEEWFSSEMGLIIPTQNEEELEKALRKMLLEYQTWDLSKAIEKVRTLYSEKEIGKKLLDFYS